MGDNISVFPGEKTNIFRKTLFKIFKNIQTIIIYTTYNGGGYPCMLSFLSLLSEIEKGSFNKITIKGVHDDEEPSWIFSSWKKEENKLIEKYKEKNLKILFKNTTNSKG
eukprot:372631_1